MSSAHEIERYSHSNDGTNNRIEKNRAENEIDDVADKMEAGETAVAKKLVNPGKDLDSEYQRAKESSEENKEQGSSKEVFRSYIPHYKKILVPHDGAEISDKALAHAIYISKISKAEIVILNAVEDLSEIAPTSISAGQNPETSGSEITNMSAESKEIDRDTNLTTHPDAMVATSTKSKSANAEELSVTIQGHLTEMIKGRIALCKEAGVEAHVSYRIQTGSVVDRIVNIAKEIDADLIIMVSEKLGSSIKSVMSSTRKVIDAVETPVLVLNK